jgi:hypothetical protein
LEFKSICRSTLGADSTNADWVNGIVLEVIDKMADYSNILQYYWHSSEASTTSNRPKAIVETAFTQYGADVGSGHNNSGYEIASRQNLLLSDGVNVVRFFDHPVDDPNRDYINNFFNKNSPYYSNSGIKAIIVFAAIDYKWRNQTASDYANRVNAVLSMPIMLILQLMKAVLSVLNLEMRKRNQTRHTDHGKV